MADVHDVAAAILKQTGPLDTYKLQKLVYYCQAWHLVWDDEPMFDARIEAWSNGPVIPALYNEHWGQYRVSTWEKGDPGRLSKPERGTVKAVVSFYADKSGQWLSQLTHRERPWREARAGLSIDERGDREITLASMLEYYGGIDRSGRILQLGHCSGPQQKEAPGGKILSVRGYPKSAQGGGGRLCRAETIRWCSFSTRE